MNILKHLLLFTLCLIGTQTVAQEHEEHGSEDIPFHKVGVALTHVNISSGVKDAGSKWITLPGFSLDYDYVFSKKWSVGLHTDIIIEKFAVKENLDSDEEIIERSYPIAPAVMLGRRLGHHTILLGAGAEFEKEETLFLNRFTYEYGIEISEKWEVGLSFSYDLRWNAYDSYILGIVLCRKL
ncbi:hypothetical protein [Mangrovimonas spongiae]|uniref:Outer membrane protein beta-barrel domain-containing protein n=1 Tax=Mangrovimonas spongiae TaxID=2494697 RepID=A0A3R9N596_9FLAO|nr:hypothetical protein [Mangrovimonas spongiae]RSK39306.1 hypothetical protein EJA19_10280 [Mangrovimonas spongiae]